MEEKLNEIRTKLNELKAKSIANQQKPCTEDYYSGIYQGVLLSLNNNLNGRLNCYMIENSNCLASAVVFSTSKNKAMQTLKEYFNPETNKTFEEYNSENPDEFENEQEFNEWKFEDYYEIFPNDDTSISEIIQTDGTMIQFFEGELIKNF